jgi:hypothetical protein
MRLQETGIISQLGNRFLKTSVDRCMIRNIEAESQAGNALSLPALVSAFLILGIGVGLSLLVFGIELIVFWIALRNKMKQAFKPAINKTPIKEIKMAKTKSIKPNNVKNAIGKY